MSLPGGGSIETWEWCADMGYLYAYLSYSGYMRAKAIMDGFWQRMDEKGKEPNPYQAGFFQDLDVGGRGRGWQIQGGGDLLHRAAPVGQIVQDAPAQAVV